MEARGVRFQPSLSGTNAFFLGGGTALVNAYDRTAVARGVEVRCEAPVTHLEVGEDRIDAVVFAHDGREPRLSPKAVVVASGGFQADTVWLARAWGPVAKAYLIRGTPYKRSIVLADLLDQGVAQVGDPTQGHTVAIDGRAPKVDGGIVTRLGCVPFSIVVNKNAERFCDESEDVWPKRDAIFGRLVAAQPDQVGFVIIDAKALDLFMPSVVPPIQAEALEALAEKLGRPLDKPGATVARFNAACGDVPGFPPASSTGLPPPASCRPIRNGSAPSPSRRSTTTRCAPARPSPISG